MWRTAATSSSTLRRDEQAHPLAGANAVALQRRRRAPSTGASSSHVIDAVRALRRRRGVPERASRSRAPIRTARPLVRRRLGNARARSVACGQSASVQPRGDHRADGFVETDVVPGVREPLDVGLGHASAQVGQEPVVEHRVAAAPQQQGRTVAASSTAAHVRRGPPTTGRPGRPGCRPTKSRDCARGVRRRGRGRAAPRGALRRSSRRSPRRTAGVRRQTRSTRPGARRSAAGRPRRRAWPRPCWPGPAPRRRATPAAPTATGPPQSWAASTRGPSTSWRQKATSSSTRSARRRGRPRSDQPMPVWSTAMTRQSGDRVVQQVAPHVAPRRVAVDADDRPGGSRPGVEHVPVDRTSVAEPSMATRRDQAGSSPHRRSWSGVGSVGRAGRGLGLAGGRHAGYQTSSAAAQFSPEPMPISSTRSPAAISSAIVDKRVGHGGRAHVAEPRVGERHQVHVDARAARRAWRCGRRTPGA